MGCNNPIKLVRQSAKREKVSDVLDLAELQLLLSKLFARERSVALLDAATGLRVSELLARGRCQTVQELLRHANSRITLDVYTQEVTSTSGPHRRIMILKRGHTRTTWAQRIWEDCGKFSIRPTVP